MQALQFIFIELLKSKPLLLRVIKEIDLEVSMKNKILMSPDYGNALFGNEENCCIGGFDSLFIDEVEIDLSGIIGLKDWFLEWERYSLWQTNYWRDAEWKEWWERGLQYAKGIKAILPANVDIQYFSQQEPIWLARPENSDDGGLMNCGEPVNIGFPRREIYENEPPF